jgi:methylmalonyl-CoA/ethylmalonyl-CoA epimerase
MGNTSAPARRPTISGALLDHVAFGVESMQRAAEFLVGTLGGAPHEGGPGPGYTGAQWKFEGGARLELIEPLGDDGFLHRFLRARGPGVHHVTFIVPDLAQGAHAAEALGYDVVGYNDAFPSWKECFLHPKQALGLVVQMAQKSDEPDAANTWSSEFAFPGPRDPAPPARVVALRLSAPERDPVLRQWRELLGGRLEERSDGLLAFYWPKSPIHLLVEIGDPSPAGPTQVEVASLRLLALPEGSQTALGARFVQVAEPP